MRFVAAFGGIKQGARRRQGLIAALLVILVERLRGDEGRHIAREGPLHMHSMELKSSRVAQLVAHRDGLAHGHLRVLGAVDGHQHALAAGHPACTRRRGRGHGRDGSGGACRQPAAQHQHQQRACDAGAVAHRIADDDLGHLRHDVGVDKCGIGHGHGAGNPAQQHAAEGDDEGETVHQLDDHLAAPDDDRNADQHAKDDQYHAMAAARRFGRAGDGDDVVHAHHEVGHDHGLDGTPELVAALDIGVAVFVFWHQQLDADPEQQQRADDLEERNRQQLQCEKDQDDAQHDGAGCAPQDALRALLGRQLAAGQRDHHRVVTAEQNVDHDDLTDRDPEFRSHEHFHLVYSLRLRANYSG